jgi:hypothetical protein
MMQYPGAAQYSPPAWHQPMTIPIQLFASARQTHIEVTPANEVSV